MADDPDEAAKKLYPNMTKMLKREAEYFEALGRFMNAFDHDQAAESSLRDGRTADLLVIGLGYVGLSLAREAAFSGLTVVGYDLNAGLVAGLNAESQFTCRFPSRREGLGGHGKSPSEEAGL